MRETRTSQSYRWTHPLPEALRGLVEGGIWQPIEIGCSDAYTFSITINRGELLVTRFYLKIAAFSSDADLAAERARLEWLQGRLPVPQVRYYGVDAAYSYLLLSEIAGIMACEKIFEENMPGLVRLLARGLQMVHGVDIADCPFDQRLDGQIELVERRTYAGLVDEDNFDDERQGERAADLLEELKRARPASEDLVFTHGDFCLPNVIINPQQTEMSGLIDWGRGGIADRYQDIALAARSLAYNFSPQWIPVLFEEYGLAEPDQEKLRYFQLLDEFF